MPTSKSITVGTRRRLYIWGLRWRLRRAVRRADTVQELVHVAMNTSCRGLSIEPFQLEDELLEFLEIVEQRRPRTVLEIGSAKGGTLFLLCQMCPPDALLISLDLPQGAFGGASYPRWKEPLYRAFRRKDQTLHLLRADSHDPQTVLEIRRLLGERPLDLLFIDGDHSYEGVRQDFASYSGLVGPEGLIALHDITPGPPEAVGGVPRFWTEVSAHFEGRAIRSPHHDESFGIGLVRPRSDKASEEV